MSSASGGSGSLNTAAPRWGNQSSDPAAASTMQTSNTTSIGSSTFNITNNNNINYNYGDNVTAIGSDGKVPTFQDLDKQSKSNDKGSYLGQLTSAVGNIVPASVSGAI